MRLTERLVEIHPDKLISVLERYLAEGRDDEVRQALPDLVKQHPPLADALHAMEQRLVAKTRMIDVEAPYSGIELITGNAATVLACGSCGGILTRQSPDSIEIICQYCGNETTLNDAVPGERWHTALDPDAAFGIGSIFTLDEERWQVIGMQQFEGQLREWDSEDHCWETNHAAYTSWWMLNAQRELAWLIDDGSARYWSTPTVPDDPTPPDPQARQLEHGEWQLVDAAGEFSYQVRHGERHATIEKPDKQRALSMETRRDANDKPIEIEFFLSRTLPNRVVIEGVGDQDTLLQLRDNRRLVRTFFGIGIATVVAYCLLLAIIPRTELLSADVTLTSFTEVVEVGTVSADMPASAYEIRIDDAGPLPRDGWLAFEVELASLDGSTVGYLPLEIWRESGRDSDGDWLESDYDDAVRLKIPTSANYRVSIVDIESDVYDLSTAGRLSIHANALSIWPAGTSALLAVCIALFLQMRGAMLINQRASLPPAGRRHKVTAPAPAPPSDPNDSDPPGTRLHA